MKVYINDELGYEWAYDTEAHRFYLNSPEVEKELGERNGYYCDPESIRSMVIGKNAVVEFERARALNFCRIVKAIAK